VNPDPHEEDGLVDHWDFDLWDDEVEADLEVLGPPAWRRPAILAISAVTALALALVPLYNLFGPSAVAENGLEICSYDYCVVEEAVAEAGLAPVMSRLSNTFLDDAETLRLAEDVAAFLDVSSVGITVVDRLGGRLGGVYDPATRSILIERPARAWTVIHEMAHVVASGHGDEFLDVLIEITAWLDGS
jgi:hypothetical protein